MANPDPKALMDASKAMGEQAKAAREAMLSERARREDELRRAGDDAAIARNSAQTAVEGREFAVKRDQDGIDRGRTNAANYEKEASAAESAGNHAQATELRETAAHETALADGYEANLHREQHQLATEQIAVIQTQSVFDDASQALSKYHADLTHAENQIDAMENKAQMLGQAGRKLALATTEDNVVDRATLENDAEKLLKDANGIQIDAAAINTVTGQTLTVPDVPPAVADTDTSASASDGAQTTDAQTDATATGAGADTGADADAATADSGGHLQDPLTADDAPTTAAPTTAADTTATDTTATDTTATDTTPTDPAATTGFDDPLGVDTSAAANTAAVTPPDDVVGTSTATDTAATAPADDATSFSDTAGDTLVDTTNAPDPTFDQPDAAPVMDDFAADPSPAPADTDSSDNLDS